MYFSSSEELEKQVSLPGIRSLCEKYSCLLEKDTEMPEPEDIEYALSLYGNPEQIDTLLAAESKCFGCIHMYLVAILIVSINKIGM